MIVHMLWLSKELWNVSGIFVGFQDVSSTEHAGVNIDFHPPIRPGKYEVSANETARKGKITSAELIRIGFCAWAQDRLSCGSIDLKISVLEFLRWVCMLSQLNGRAPLYREAIFTVIQW